MWATAGCRKGWHLPEHCSQLQVVEGLTLWKAGAVTWVSMWQSLERLPEHFWVALLKQSCSCAKYQTACFFLFSWELLDTEILSYKIKVIDIVIYNTEGSPVRFNFVSCFFFVCHLFWASVPHLVLGRWKMCRLVFCIPLIKFVWLFFFQLIRPEKCSRELCFWALI